MGGIGSGRRKDYRDVRRKRLVEDALTLDLSELNINAFIAQRKGELFWKRGEIKHTTMLFRVGEIDGSMILYLSFVASLPQGPVTVRERIPLLTTRPFFGGQRWWFSCPCCLRRVRVLYIPKGCYRWECRLCHRLTYRSVREHDKRVDALMKSPDEVKRILDEYLEAPVDAITSTCALLAMRTWPRLSESRTDYNQAYSQGYT
ncbi:MAG: hypothetical protein ACYTEQ_21150 [Planctomycetota bacterium]|jgi:hypothetical protein